jgi:hypothetical protein
MQMKFLGMIAVAASVATAQLAGMDSAEAGAVVNTRSFAVQPAASVGDLLKSYGLDTRLEDIANGNGDMKERFRSDCASFNTRMNLNLDCDLKNVKLR